MGLAPVWFITGEHDVGKTYLCQRFASQAHALGWVAAGILSPAVLLDGKKIAIQALDVRMGELHPLAVLAQSGQGGTRTERWLFNDSAIEWGNTVWRAATPCDLLLVDELGPLELERGEGWIAAIPAVRSGQFKLALVVVRPELLAAARGLFPTARDLDVAAAEGCRLETLLHPF
ncbi:MAG: hypothetical protein HPY76_10730 [Anaerolineae bacterium]|nr:hypothetical protein [Anaerolineae bacterium]